MKVVKGALVVFIGLFVFVTLISLLIPSRIVTTRAETVQADSIKLYSEIADLKNWKHWHPVFMQDSGKMNYSTTSTNVNDFVEWSSNNKKNRVLIAEKKFPYIKVLLQRDGENDMENVIALREVQEQGNMQVQWTAITKLKWYPWEKFASITSDKVLGPYMEKSLDNLKNLLENHQA